MMYVCGCSCVCVVLLRCALLCCCVFASCCFCTTSGSGDRRTYRATRRVRNGASLSPLPPPTPLAPPHSPLPPPTLPSRSPSTSAAGQGAGGARPARAAFASASDRGRLCVWLLMMMAMHIMCASACVKDGQVMQGRSGDGRRQGHARLVGSCSRHTHGIPPQTRIVCSRPERTLTRVGRHRRQLRLDEAQAQVEVRRRQAVARDGGGVGFEVDAFWFFCMHLFRAVFGGFEQRF